VRLASVVLPALLSCLLSSESFVLSTSTGVIYFPFSFCFHRLLDGWEACTRCFAGPVIELDRLVVDFLACIGENSGR